MTTATDFETNPVGTRDAYIKCQDALTRTMLENLDLRRKLDVWRSMDRIVVGKGQTFIIEGNK